jgi:hypothetical protein
MGCLCFNFDPFDSAQGMLLTPYPLYAISDYTQKPP